MPLQRQDLATRLTGIETRLLKGDADLAADATGALTGQAPSSFGRLGTVGIAVTGCSLAAFGAPFATSSMPRRAESYGRHACSGREEFT